MITFNEFYKIRGRGLQDSPSPDIWCNICNGLGLLDNNYHEAWKLKGEGIGGTECVVCIACAGRAIPPIPMSEL